MLLTLLDMWQLISRSISLGFQENGQFLSSSDIKVQPRCFANEWLCSFEKNGLRSTGSSQSCATDSSKFSKRAPSNQLENLNLVAKTNSFSKSSSFFESYLITRSRNTLTVQPVFCLFLQKTMKPVDFFFFVDRSFLVKIKRAFSRETSFCWARMSFVRFCTGLNSPH